MPRLGIWAERQVNACAKECKFQVIAPIPLAPPLLSRFGNYRGIPKSRTNESGVRIYHPKMLIPPGYRFHGVEAWPYHYTVKPLVEKLQHEQPIDLIHAHFAFPDGCVATKLGKQMNIPVIISDHASWVPWMEEYPRVCRQAVQASHDARFHVSVSAYLQSTIVQFTGASERHRIVPNIVEEDVFTLDPANSPDPNRILFVGVIREVKGLDVLLRALAALRDQGSPVHLVVMAETFYASYDAAARAAKGLVVDLRLQNQVHFIAPGDPYEQDPIRIRGICQI